MNYAAHAAESGSAPPTIPILFLKPPNTVVGPFDAVDIPRASAKTDWEVELGVVIGTTALYLDSPADAAAHIAGYVTVNDVSEREFQLELSGGQWSKGKASPGFTPVGPWLVTPDEVDAANLRLRSFVNGEPRQDSSTADLIFGVDYLIWYLEPVPPARSRRPDPHRNTRGRGTLGPVPVPRRGRCGRDGRSTGWDGSAPSSRRLDNEHDDGQANIMNQGGGMASEFDELNAIVTGGASGIGAAVVRRLLSGGARVAVLDLDIATASSESFAVVADVADDASVRAAVEKVAAEFGHIDIVINNAGIGAQGTVEENDDAEWARVLNINVTGMARVTRAALPHLRESEHAAIVNVSSIVATAGLPSRVLYSASKGAVAAMTRAMAADHVRQGIRVNAVSPGTADTPWVQRLLSAAADPEAERVALEARQPHGRLVSPDEIADAVAYLASPRSGSTTGISLSVDGGVQELRLRAE